MKRKPINPINPRVLYPVDHGGCVHASPVVVTDLERLARLRAEDVLLRKQIELLEQSIRSVMGVASEIRGEDDKVLATWRNGPEVEVFDLERFKTEHPQLATEYTVSKPGYRRLLLQVKP